MNSQRDPAGNAKELEEANRLFESVWKRVIQGSELCPIVVDAHYEDKKTEEATSQDGMAHGMTGHHMEGHHMQGHEMESHDMTHQEMTCQGSTDEQAGKGMESHKLPMLCSTVVSRQEEQGEMDCENDFPSRQAVPFLGCGSAAFEELLHECIRRELHSRQVYKHLGQRAGGPAAKHFSAMAAENLRAAKRLGAACFLITGAQPKAAPSGRLAISSYLGTLRDHFIEEQQSSALYLAAAAESRDPWLVRLFSELAEEKLENAHRIYLLVEMA